MRSRSQELIPFAVQAPSSHNTQPWKFMCHGEHICLYPDFNRRLPVVDPDNHALFISLGCALENLLISAQHFGYAPAVAYHLQETPAFVSVHLQAAGTPAGSGALFAAIPQRQSTRSKYQETAIPAAHLEKLALASEQEGISCSIITDTEEITLIAALVREACIRQFSNPLFKAELLHWIRFNQKAAHQTLDGLRAACMGSPAVPSWLGRLIFAYTATPQAEADNTASMMQGSPALALFSVQQHHREAWVKLGQSFERVALQATALNIKHAHLNMPCEEPAVRAKLKQLPGYITGEPLLLIRLGYADPLPYSYRRPVAEVMRSGPCNLV